MSATLRSMENKAAEFVKWLQLELMERDWTQRELAYRAGLSETTISGWINDVQPPSRRSARAIAEALGIDEAVVFEKAGIPARPYAMRSGAEFRTGNVYVERSTPPERRQARYRRTERPIRGIESLTPVPVIGRVPADSLRWTQGEEPADLLPELDLQGIQDPALVIATGDCLIERGIQSGTRVLIDRSATPSKPGEIVVMRVHDEVTMKEWYPVNGGIILRASSEGYPPIFITENEMNQEDVEMIGVARLYYRVGRL